MTKPTEKTRQRKNLTDEEIEFLFVKTIVEEGVTKDKFFFEYTKKFGAPTTPSASKRIENMYYRADDIINSKIYAGVVAKLRLVHSVAERRKKQQQQSERDAVPDEFGVLTKLYNEFLVLKETISGIESKLNTHVDIAREQLEIAKKQLELFQALSDKSAKKKSDQTDPELLQGVTDPGAVPDGATGGG